VPLRMKKKCHYQTRGKAYEAADYRRVHCGGVLLGAGSGRTGLPEQPVRFIVPWSAGSGTDLMARAFAQELAKALGNRSWSTTAAAPAP